MPGGSEAVATVSSNRSRSPDLKRSRLRYEFLLIGSGAVEQASAGLSSKQRISFASRLCQAVKFGRPFPAGPFSPIYQMPLARGATAINWHRNKSFGPGGGTRRLHPSPLTKRVSAGAK